MDLRTECRKYKPCQDFIPYENISKKNERNYKRLNLSRGIEYHDFRQYDYVSIQTIASKKPIILTREDVLEATITHDGLHYKRYNDKKVHSRTSSRCLDEGIYSRFSNEREISWLINEYPISVSRVRQIESQLKETQDPYRATMRKTELICNTLSETQVELARVYEERDSYMNDVDDLQSELIETEAQLEEVETRNYTLTKDYEALERDNVYLRRCLDELTQTLQDKLSRKDRRDLHHIRRRILVHKAVEALKRRYCSLYPMRPNESFFSWSKRVGYPGWEQIASMVMDAKYHGNKSAHRATQAEMLQTVTLALEDDLESGDTSDGEVLRDMYNIVYFGGHG